MDNWECFNRQLESRYSRLGADRQRIGDLLAREELPADASYRLAELQREIDITMSEGWA